MPMKFGTGEIAERLRRFLDFRGRFPGQLDETIVPVAIVGQADRTPYRSSGVRWWGSFDMFDADITSHKSISVHNLGSGICTVDLFTVWWMSTIGEGIMLLGTRTGDPAGISLRVNAVTTERGRPNFTLPGSDSGTEPVPVEIINHDDPASQLGTTLARVTGGSSQGNQQNFGGPSPSSNLLDGKEFTLAPGMYLTAEELLARAARIVGTWSGLYFDDVPAAPERRAV